MIDFLNWWAESWGRVIFAVFLVIMISEALSGFASTIIYRKK